MNITERLFLGRLAECPLDGRSCVVDCSLYKCPARAVARRQHTCSWTISPGAHLRTLGRRCRQSCGYGWADPSAHPSADLSAQSNTDAYPKLPACQQHINESVSVDTSGIKELLQLPVLHFDVYVTHARWHALRGGVASHRGCRANVAHRAASDGPQHGRRVPQGQPECPTRNAEPVPFIPIAVWRRQAAITATSCQQRSRRGTHVAGAPLAPASARLSSLYIGAMPLLPQSLPYHHFRQSYRFACSEGVELAYVTVIASAPPSRC